MVTSSLYEGKVWGRSLRVCLRLRETIDVWIGGCLGKDRIKRPFVESEPPDDPCSA